MVCRLERLRSREDVVRMKGGGGNHSFSFDLYKIKINSLSFRSMNNLSLQQPFCSFTANNLEGMEVGGTEGDTVTFTATMTVTRDMCGL